MIAASWNKTTVRHGVTYYCGVSVRNIGNTTVATATTTRFPGTWYTGTIRCPNDTIPRARLVVILLAIIVQLPEMAGL